MKIIKLDAIDSTNSFTKELAKSSVLENYTIVVAKNQTKGRGQQHTNWVSEPYKNLTFSVFINDIYLSIDNQRYLNFAISYAIFKVLQKLNIPDISIKWANDIMSANKKLCGILIENTFRKDRINSTIVGIGLNVNQTKFSESAKKANSLKSLTGKTYDLDELLLSIVDEMKVQQKKLKKQEFENLENEYLKNLYRKDKVSTFKDSDNNLFNGIIKGVSKKGLLQVELENESLKEYAIKEISFA